LLRHSGFVGAGLVLPLGYRAAPAGAAPTLDLFEDVLPDLLAVHGGRVTRFRRS